MPGRIVKPEELEPAPKGGGRIVAPGELDEAAAPEPSKLERVKEYLAEKLSTLGMPEPRTMTGGSAVAAAYNRKHDRAPVAALMSAAKGATYNAAPYIAAGFDGLGKGPAEALAGALEGDYGANVGEEISKEASRSLPEWKRIYRQAQEDEPAAYLAGAIAAPGPRGKSAATRIALATALGTGSAALDAPEGEILEGGVKGGLETAALSTGLEVLPPLARAIGKSMRGSAESAAVRAAGLRGGITDRLRAMGIRDMAGAQRVGREFLDERLIPVGGTTDSVAARADRLRGDVHNEAQGILGGIDEAGGQFDFAKGALRAKSNSLDGITRVQDRASGKARDFIKDFAGQGRDTPGSFAAANQAKSDAYRTVNWGTEAPASAEIHKNSLSGARQSIEDQVADFAGTGVADQLRNANRRYGIGARATNLSEMAQSRDAVKMSLPEKLTVAGLAAAAGSTGGASGAVVGGLGGLAATFGSDVVRGRGASTVARSADALSKFSSAIGDAAQGVSQAGSPAAKAAAAQEFVKYFGTEPEDDEQLSAEMFKLAP